MRDVGARPGVRVDRGRRGDGSGSARQDQSYKLETTRLRENADSIRHGGIEIKHSMRHTSHVMRISTFNQTFVKSSNRS